MQKITSTILFALLFVLGAYAQEIEMVEKESGSKLSVGLHLGGSQSGTDTHSWGRHGEGLLSQAHVVYGLQAKYQATKSLSLRLNWFETNISGDDNDVFGPCNDIDASGVESEDLSDCQEHDFRGWSFESPLRELGLDLEWELLGKRRGYNENGSFKKAISPYIHGGVALTFVDPTTDYITDTGYQPSMASQAQDIADQKSSYLHFPVGAGLRIDLSEKMFLDLEARGVFPQTDLLDGMSATTNFEDERQNEDSYHFVVARINLRLGGIGDDDGDGVNNNLDKCPQLPGLLTAMGCPDTDGDGIIDTNDNCPNVAGVKRLSGCPDADGDNVADADDKCPNVAGLVRFNGCPDSDGDGIADNNDDCPKVAGEKEYNGCLAPDTDGDGVVDRDDKCVNTPGTVRGCPDSDRDGIIDSEDKCPTVPGIASEMGCPKKKIVTTSKVVTTRPSTVISRPVLLTCETIYFNTNQSSVSNNTKDRYLDAAENVAILNRALAKLNENSTYRAVVQGHTDSRNTDEYNQKLSERRANEVLQGMITKGFPAARSSAVGFGESSPIATNDSKEGRAQNRRVEICIYDR